MLPITTNVLPATKLLRASAMPKHVIDIVTRYNYLFAGMMSLGKFFIINVLNQLNACKICLELWTFIIYMTCIGGNFSALCIKSAKAGQTIYSCMTQNSVFVTG